MPFNNDAKHLMLDTLAALVDELSLHSADPGAGGSNEIEADSVSAYARQSVTWAASASGEKKINAAIEFQVPAGVTITHVGMWAGGSEPTFYGSMPLPSPETFGNAGVLSLDTETKLDINDPN